MATINALPQPEAARTQPVPPSLRWGLVAGFWTLLAFVSATQIYVSMLAHGHSWWRLFGWQLSGAALWAALTPLVLWLGKHCPPVGDRWPFGLGAHLAASVAVAALRLVPLAWVKLVIDPYRPLSEPATWRQVYLSALGGSFVQDVLIYWAILAAGYAFALYRRQREREVEASQLEAELARAELQALKLELHPHFLFNTLNGIAALIRKGERKAAVSMVAGLSELLRQTLEQSGRQEVTLERELDFVERYLAIQRLRFGNRLATRVDASPGCLSIAVPNMILQPLVENAIEHGTSRSAHGGRVVVEAHRTGDRLRIRVEDDGPGPGGGSGVPHSGLGLANARSRLEALYGPRHRLELSPAPGGRGTVVTLEVPWRALEDGSEERAVDG
jgi:two-component system LytT family sensor kinase